MEGRIGFVGTVMAALMFVAACQSGGGTVAVELSTTPTPPKMGTNTLDVVVKGADGAAVTDASVTAEVYMPAMPAMNMPEMRSTATLTHRGEGRYRGEIEFMSSGNWHTTVTVRRGTDTIATETRTLTAQP